MSAAGQVDEQLAEFRRCSTAEQYFELLDVDFDPRVVAVNRLHILRYFAGEIAGLHDAEAGSQSPEELLRHYREALIRSYEAFTTATALDHRLFKVLKDRAPEPEAFVPVSEITIERPATAGPQGKEQS
ncbi:nitrogenase-stabilizing/protective protein [Parafrankia irregularis]|uniref:Nitrogenase-stabilizing/protective protein NifW n=1 Tax=Parafrankia irregularis TaxID=795642 RepID=A0A0S4QKC3_9ACTN|nr:MULTISPECIES: nitrogenase-stabilizing/protective protein NifW [Parafrankia]MBE3203885.1 nitrogenase-stabilizing/protective protein NifW [Parafrankia sp. CH37]CUU55244.1 nitrogenase-stabilizing/protective protein [Parafrankia irregularis]